MAVYHAFHYGKKNQSFKLENEENRSLYEANLVNFKLFGASDFDFVNHLTSKTTSHKVDKTISVDHGTGGFSMTTRSYFKLDGKSCYDVLAEKGYSIKLIAKLELLHPEFGLYDKDGYQVAIYKMNVTGEKEADVFAIGNKQSNTVITTDCNDMDAVFLGAFILSRVDFSLYLM